MPADVAAPRPEVYQPALRWWSHAWRIAVMIGLGLVVVLSLEQRETGAALVVDVVVGLVCLVLTFWRRRFPMTVVVVTTVLSTVSGLASGPSTLAAVSLATRRRWGQVVVAGVLNEVCAEVYGALHPSSNHQPFWVSLATGVVFTSAALAWGMYIGSRRELLWTLRERAVRAEAEQELRTEQSRAAERARIAREMHDVLAHRITQISLRAGALSFRQDLTAAEMRESAVVIQEAAHAALADLRGVLGVLRDDAGGLLDAPQPTFADVPDLVAQARDSGARIAYVESVVHERPLPDATGRTLYRIIQEGITNAGKHAPGARLSIEVAGSPDDGIDVTLRNPLGFAGATPTGPAAPGAGLGLVGLTERAGLRGGRLEHRHEGGDFVVHGWLPWAA